MNARLSKRWPVWYIYSFSFYRMNPPFWNTPSYSLICSHTAQRTTHPSFWNTPATKTVLLLCPPPLRLQSIHLSDALLVVRQPVSPFFLHNSKSSQQTKKRKLYIIHGQDFSRSSHASLPGNWFTEISTRIYGYYAPPKITQSQWHFCSHIFIWNFHRNFHKNFNLKPVLVMYFLKIKNVKSFPYLWRSIVSPLHKFGSVCNWSSYQKKLINK